MTDLDATFRSLLPVFADLAEASYKTALKSGWHTDLETGQLRTIEQNHNLFPTRIALIHSEISEALEGDRKRLKDDKLPHRDMAEVELADTVIRIFDLCGCMGWTDRLVADLGFASGYMGRGGVSDSLARLHYCVSIAYELFHNRRNTPLAIKALARAVGLCYEICEAHGWNLIAAMQEKMVFNAQRPDHKHEARKATGGKLY